MEITVASVLDVWDFFSEYVPASKRNDAAIKYIKLYTDQDIEPGEFDEIRGEDVHLDHALDALTGNAEPDVDDYNSDDY